MRWRAALLFVGLMLFIGTLSRGGAGRAGRLQSRQDVFATVLSFLPPTAASNPAVAGQQTPLLRVVTYNVHSCKGLDFRIKPNRIADVLRLTGADVIALQEVRAEQASDIARRLGFNVFYGHADVVHGHDFGNAILSRFPIRTTRLYAIGVPHRQQRACLRADLVWPGHRQIVHVFTVHLGLSGSERRIQVARLASPEILSDPALQNEPKIFLGDFNEKTAKGFVDQHLPSLLQRAARRTWPALLPMFYLDRVYFSREMKLRSSRVYRSGSALVASDHAPLLVVLQRISPAGADARHD